MASEKKTVIFYAIHKTSFNVMRRLAEAAYATGVYRPVFLLNRVAHKARIVSNDVYDVLYTNAGLNEIMRLGKKHAGRFLQNGITNLFRVFYGVIFAVTEKTIVMLIRISRFFENITGGLILRLSLYQLFRVVPELLLYGIYKIRFGKMLDALQPSALFVYTDNLGGINAILAKMCKDRGIKVIIPMVAYQHPEIQARPRSGNPVFRIYGNVPVINKLLARKFPGQVYYIKDKGVFFYHAYEIIAMNVLDILPEYPWIRGRNLCDYMCVEDFYQRDMLLKEEVNKDRLVVTGHIDCDDIPEIIKHSSRADIVKRYGLDPGKKIILLSLANLKEQGDVGTWDEHWAENEKLISIASGTGASVILVLHPKMDINMYRYLETRFPCRMHDGKTSEVIPFADIYIEHISSTLFWAVQYGKVVIDVGSIYGYSTDNIAYLKSLFIVRSYDEYQSLISRLIADAEYFRMAQEAVAREAEKYFLPVDGKNVERTFALIDNETGSKKGRAACLIR